METTKRKFINFSLVESNKYLFTDSQFNIIDKIFIVIYLFLSCFETYMPSVISGSTKYIMLAVCFLLLIKDIFRRNLIIRWHIVLMVLWLALKLLSVFWGGYNDIVSLHFISQFGFVLLFVAFGLRDYSEKDKQFFVYSILLTTFLFSLLSIIFQAPYNGIYVSRRVLTLFGKQLDPNNCAAFETICFAISIYFTFFKKKYIFCIPVIVSGVACLLSGSRAGLLAVVLIFIVAVLLFPLKGKWSLLIKIFSLLVLGAIVFLLCLFILPPETFKRLFLEGYISSGGGERDNYWKLAFDMFANKPIFGHGWGTASYFGKAQSEAVHNTFLAMMAENGIVGLGLFVSYPIFCLASGIKNKNYLIILLFIAFFVPAFFIDSINKRFIWNILFVFLTLSAKNIKPIFEHNKRTYNEKVQYYRIDI